MSVTRYGFCPPGITLNPRSEKGRKLLLRLVEDAQAAKAPIQKLVDKVSQVFVPAVLLVALATLLVWLLLGASAEQALLNAVAGMDESSLWAVGITSTPT